MHGIDKQDFAVMRRLATLYRAHPAKAKGGGARAKTPAGRLACARAELGVASKRLINEARAAGLGAGWSSRLVRYVPPEISPENTLLLAHGVIGGILIASLASIIETTAVFRELISLFLAGYGISWHHGRLQMNSKS